MSIPLTHKYMTAHFPVLRQTLQQNVEGLKYFHAPKHFPLPLSVENNHLLTLLCIVHVDVVFHFCDSMCFFFVLVKVNLFSFCILCFYMYCLWRSSYQEDNAATPFTELTLSICILVYHFIWACKHML
jgi:hypothetical protein